MSIYKLTIQDEPDADIEVLSVGDCEEHARQRFSHRYGRYTDFAKLIIKSCVLVSEDGLYVL